MTLAELRDALETRRRDAAAMHATAPVADVLSVVLAELDCVQPEVADVVREDLVDVHEMASLMKVTIRHLYVNWRKYPFARKLSHKVLRFSLNAYARWLLKRAPTR